MRKQKGILTSELVVKKTVYAILIFFKSVVIFVEIKKKSVKMTTLLKKMRIAQIHNCLLKMNGL